LVNEPQPVGCESKRTDKTGTGLTNVYVYNLTKDAIETCKSCKDYIETQGISLCMVYEKTKEMESLFPAWVWNADYVGNKTV